MDIKKLVAVLKTHLNDLVDELEELTSAQPADDDEDDKPARSSKRGAAKDDDAKDKPARSKRDAAKDKDADDDEEEDKDGDDDGDDDDDGEEASEADIAKAARAALKVLESDDVKKIIRKHGKADRATEVKPALRQKVIDALEEAIEDAK